MNTMDHASSGFLFRVLLWIGFLGFGLMLSSTAREKHIAARRWNFEIAPEIPGAVASPTSSRQDESVEAKNKTVLDMTPAELRRFYQRDLTNLEFNLNQDQLEYLLEKVGDKVSAFFRDFSNTSSKEVVRLSRYPGKQALGAFAAHGFMADEIDREFKYLILPRTGKDGISLLEARSDKHNRPVDQKAPSGFTMSLGYAGLCLFLHPSHQADSFFRYLGREKRKPRVHIIAFAQKPESRSYAQFSDSSLFSRPIRFQVQGLVWVNPESYQILRIRTHMLLPEKPTILKEQITDIYYESVQFDHSRQQFWLPREVRVRWEFPDWIYSNRHRYFDYHLFTVESDYKITQPSADK